MKPFSNPCSIGLILFVFATGTFTACNRRPKVADEQIQLHHHTDSTAPSDSGNTIGPNASASALKTYPHAVVLTGMADHRLVTIYLSKKIGEASKRSFSSYYEPEYVSEWQEHFMPGLDLIYGFNLINVGHYSMHRDSLNLLFDKPVLVRSLYYPSFVQDSLNGKPVNRDYFMVSVYESDTNGDTLINKQDLRRFYHFNADCSRRTQLIPASYSVERSQYDPQNDAMFVYARHDENRDGTADQNEPLHIFWFSLRAPTAVKRMY